MALYWLALTNWVVMCDSATLDTCGNEVLKLLFLGEGKPNARRTHGSTTPARVLIEWNPGDKVCWT